MTAGFKYLKDCHKKKGEQLLYLAPEGRTQSKGFKLQQSKFRLNWKGGVCFLTIS